MVSGGSIPISSSVSSSAQSSTTTAMLASLSLNARGSPRSARSTTRSNCARVTELGDACGGRLETAHPLDVDHVGDGADGGHDPLELVEVRHLHHEGGDALAVVGDRHLGPGGVGVLGREGAGGL